VLPPHVDLALEDEHHVVGRSAFFKQNVAGIGDDFLTWLASHRRSSSAGRAGANVYDAAAISSTGVEWRRCGSERKHRGASGEQI